MSLSSGSFSARTDAHPSFAQIHRFPRPAAQLLEECRRLNLFDAVTFRDFLQRVGERFAEMTTRERVGQTLVAAGILTEYQLQRLLSGQTHGLVLGHYRILDKLGSGTVGLVFLGEHVLLRRRVAIKVLPVDDTFPMEVIERFHSEMQVLSNLRHPHIVTAYDAGILPSPELTLPTLHYLVMELVGGGDLEQYLYTRNAPLDVPQACEWIRQAAAGLQEAHDHHLIHRDLKPSNLLLSDDGIIKLVDFGLARQFSSSLTQPNALLGSLEFMAPEQSLDPTSVGGAADIYALGATMFWLLTGQTPFEITNNLVQMMDDLQNSRPRRMREFRPEIPEELDAFVDSMLERDPAKRPGSPIAVMNALSRYATPARTTVMSDMALVNTASIPQMEPFVFDPSILVAAPILVVSVDPRIEAFLSKQLIPKLGHQCTVAKPEDALHIAQTQNCSVLIVENRPQVFDAKELCQKIRERPALASLRIMLLQSSATTRDLAQGLEAGADEMLPWPVDPVLLDAKLRYLFRARSLLEQLNAFNQHLQAAHRQLETSLQARLGDIRKSQDAMLFAMAKMAEAAEGESAGHQTRLKRYAVLLAEALRDDDSWRGIIDKKFLEYLDRCTPIHDIGKVCLPDHLLYKSGQLTENDRAQIEAHPVVGWSILESISKEYGTSMGFMSFAKGLVRHHHERFDGRGYPDRLVGDQIPPAARIVALADVYDALRRRRIHKAAVSHADAVTMILEDSTGQFDPSIVQVFVQVAAQFDQIFQSIPN
ncbi:protein kinase domain-containing protein [Tuwongella immobilis]|uniref:Uncharacterized protein n=1 Tax=Tuwongella immobilis TaxID=692036 RepID=A0A6C2YNG9_9BACT